MTAPHPGWVKSTPSGFVRRVCRSCDRVFYQGVDDKREWTCGRQPCIDKRKAAVRHAIQRAEPVKEADDDR